MALGDDCATCGLSMREPLTISYHGETAEYCCFECAITQVAPECPHCHCKVIGHGDYGDDGRTFCCSHCAAMAGALSGIGAAAP